MTMFKNIMTTVMLASFGVFFIATSCNQTNSTPGIKKEETKVDTVKAFILQMDSVQKIISLPGELLPNEKVLIRAKVPGYVSKLKVDIGSRVSRGQMLALIDAPEINTRVQELIAKEKAAESRYQSSKDYYDRISNASKTDGVVAASELESARNQMLADEAERTAAESAVSSYKQIGNYLAIIAPYSGVITKRNIDVGSFVGNTNDQPLFEIENDRLLRLRVAVPEVYSNAELAGNTGELTTRSLPDKKFKAKLVRKAGSIDNETRSEIWEFEIPNTTGELKTGGYADVKLYFLRKTRSLVVPASALVTTLEKRFVIKLTNNSTKWVDARLGFNMGDKQEIFGDLQAGDTLVLNANEELKPSTRVIPRLSK
jgi:membrane fusion protein, multidrug efflux system